MTATIGELTATIARINVNKGWRPATGGPGDNTWGDYVALLNTEVAEAMEAFRDHGLDDATDTHTVWLPGGKDNLPKPEGVGSELADIVIRLLDMFDVFGFTVFDADLELDDVADAPEPPTPLVTFGDRMAWLGARVGRLWENMPEVEGPNILRIVTRTARVYGIDLTVEVQRKIAYNATRPYQHGGRAL